MRSPKDTELGASYAKERNTKSQSTNNGDPFRLLMPVKRLHYCSLVTAYHLELKTHCHFLWGNAPCPFWFQQTSWVSSVKSRVWPVKMFKITREAQKAKTQSEKRFIAWSLIYMSSQICPVKLTGKLEVCPDKLMVILAGHCLLTGCYFEPCKGKTSVKYEVWMTYRLTKIYACLL